MVALDSPQDRQLQRQAAETHLEALIGGLLSEGKDLTSTSRGARTDGAGALGDVGKEHVMSAQCPARVREHTSTTASRRPVRGIRNDTSRFEHSPRVSQSPAERSPFDAVAPRAGASPWGLSSCTLWLLRLRVV